ncbi:MAG: serine carboxypeptidase [Alphaproteobacteria bacterium]|nr:MAG: serine carboxypeptidase [Alphaproteobacteria bacterium]
MQTREYSFKWRDLIIAVVGGDDREQEIARLAGLSGANIRASGFPWPEGGISSVDHFEKPEGAMRGADIVLMPIPGIAADGSIFADQKIIPRADLLSLMASPAHIILGKADMGLVEAARQTGVTLHEYEHDNELMLLRGPAIVEAVLQVLITNTDITLHGANICIIGQGNIGSLLTNCLVKLGAHVTVAARNPVQLALAYTMGASPLPLTQFAEQAGRFDIIVSTVPAPVVTSQIVDALPSHALVVDISAPPGGCDLDYVKSSGRKGIWARALGRRAPITVGGSQWVGISKIIDTILEGQIK